MPVRKKDMPFTIKDGTSQEAESLCLTCVHVHMQRGFRESEEEVFCAYQPVVQVWIRA
jgi:hypothetical protein